MRKEVKIYGLDEIIIVTNDALMFEVLKCDPPFLFATSSLIIQQKKKYKTYIKSKRLKVKAA